MITAPHVALHRLRPRGRRHVPDERNGELLRVELAVVEWAGRVDEGDEQAGVTMRPVARLTAVEPVVQERGGVVSLLGNALV